MKQYRYFIALLLLLGVNSWTIGQYQSDGRDEKLAEISLPGNVQSWIDQELARAKIKTLMDYQSADFFRKDTSRVIGYLRGYHPEIGFSTGMIYAGNELTREDYPLVVTIHPDGRFEVDLPMNYPLYTYLAFQGRTSTFYIEPGQSLAMIIDWNDANAPTRFLGPTARINSELASIEVKSPPYSELMEKAKNVTPDEFKRSHLATWKANSEELERQLSSRKFTPQTRTIVRNELALDHAAYMFDYVSYRKYQQQQNPQNAPLDSTFYDFLHQLPLNDPSLLIPESFGTFVNRYEYDEAFWRAYSLSNEKERPANIARELLIWDLKDSILSSYYKLQSSLIHEISKTRSFGSFSGSRERAHQLLTALTPGISHPYLRLELQRIFESNFATSQSTAYSLAPGKAADIFKKIVEPHRDKVVFVDFWATTCRPCIAFIKKHKTERLKLETHQDFDFVFITSTNESPEANYLDFIKENELEHSYRISSDNFRYLRQLFKFNAIPHYVLVGKDGTILNDNFPMYVAFDERLRNRILEQFD